ncbi:chorismate mutase [Longimicrobium terrae]|uniref:chorismate mutase n=1 Tax=Longimicrobium terrae TaxID=1639882 RepID=A0A841GVK0_9BACT|nr:chorismate mutase [Longimicrobium terrae]MBB4635374.1 chorismate mutase [Longimicrobium terrae]MBB6069768.1 chorismate mutase [Longimicrobium terrae]NNC31021.1 chorismate mutase [Longimicrobium terrae]
MSTAHPSTGAVSESVRSVTEAATDGAAGDLIAIRGQIEELDRAIIHLIAERVALARRVGPAKRALGMPILDPPREAAVVRRASALARDAGVPEEDVRYVFWHLVGLCRRVQLGEEGSA